MNLTWSSSVNGLLQVVDQDPQHRQIIALFEAVFRDYIVAAMNIAKGEAPHLAPARRRQEIDKHVADLLLLGFKISTL